MDISNSDIRCCILIRGTRSSTTKEMINSYCEKYGQINYSRCALSPQGIMRGYNLVFKQEQSVNRFMDDRPHHIDGQSVKVKRCISPDEEWRLTNEILITTSDNITDKQIFQEQTLRDYFSRYGIIRACHIDTYHNRPCAYLTFTDYDRVDQLINDKPHTINKVLINIRKHITNDNLAIRKSSQQTSTNTPIKRRQYSSIEAEHHRIKQQRSSTMKIHVKEKSNINNEDNEIVRLKNANDLLIREVQSLISTPIQSIQKTTNNEIIHLQNEYERLNTQMINLYNEQNEKFVNDNTNEILNKLENDVENLLKKIKNMQQKKKTFADELFEKYTIEYILSLNENDLQQRFEQLEKENQLLLLIKQNMPNGKVPKFEPL